MPGGRLRMEKLASLMEAGRLDTSIMLTHRFKGFDHLEEALMLSLIHILCAMSISLLFALSIREEL